LAAPAKEKRGIVQLIMDNNQFMSKWLWFFAGSATAFVSVVAYRSVGRSALTNIPRNIVRKPWSIGSNQPIPYKSKNWLAYSANDLTKNGAMYNLLISCVVPRPIALVSSQDLKGRVNCAPFSYFNIVSHDPPLVVIGMCTNRDRSKKDSLNNVELTGLSLYQ
jgi:hypothetical protein